MYQKLQELKDFLKIKFKCALKFKERNLNVCWNLKKEI